VLPLLRVIYILLILVLLGLDVKPGVAKRCIVVSFNVYLYMGSGGLYPPFLNTGDGNSEVFINILKTSLYFMSCRLSS
jgi:type III secretory pathway component EscT